MAESLGEKRETSLVVYDTDFVMEVVVAVLKGANFHVLHADSGAHPPKLAADYAGGIDLFLSNLKMHGMSGPALEETLKQSQPDKHAMLMSGSTGGDLCATEILQLVS